MRCGVVLFLVLSGLCAVARTEYTVQPVADVPVNGRVWNLMQYDPVGPEVGYRVDTGDCDRVWSPVKRFDFYTTDGDSVLQTCAETRSYRVVFSPGILRGMPGEDGGSESFGFKGRIHQSRFVTGEGYSTVAPAVRGMLVMPSGDSVSGAVLHHDIVTMRWSVTADSLTVFASLPDSAKYTTVTECYRIMDRYMSFPQAFKRIDTTFLNDRVVSSDSIAWVLALSPSAEVERVRRRLLPGGADMNEVIPSEGIDGDDDLIDISVHGTEIMLSSGSQVQADIVISDVLGRTYYEANTVIGPSGNGVSVVSLPRGEYLIQVIPSAGKAVARKFIR